MERPIAANPGDRTREAEAGARVRAKTDAVVADHERRRAEREEPLRVRFDLD